MCACVRACVRSSPIWVVVVFTIQLYNVVELVQGPLLSLLQSQVCCLCVCVCVCVLDIHNDPTPNAIINTLSTWLSYHTPDTHLTYLQHSHNTTTQHTHTHTTHTTHAKVQADPLIARPPYRTLIHILFVFKLFHRRGPTTNITHTLTLLQDEEEIARLRAADEALIAASAMSAPGTPKQTLTRTGGGTLLFVVSCCVWNVFVCVLIGSCWLLAFVRCSVFGVCCLLFVVCCAFFVFLLFDVCCVLLRLILPQR